MSLQVWCYECDVYVDGGWGLIDEIKEKLNDTVVEEVTTRTQNKSIQKNGVGLYNTGNSCFINSALQILLNCPVISGYFRDSCHHFVLNREKLHPPQPSLSEQFLILFEAVNNPEW